MLLRWAAVLIGLRATPTRSLDIALVAGHLVVAMVSSALDPSGIARALLVLAPFTAYLRLGRTAGLVAGGLCLGYLTAVLAVTEPRWYADAEHISDLVMIALGIVLALATAAVAMREREYAGRVAELTTIQERNRLAREIHDSLGHHLTAITVQLEKADAYRSLDPIVADQAIDDARWSAGRALEEARDSVRELRADAPFSLDRALGDLVRHAGDDGLRVSLEVAGDETAYDASSLVALYRAAQEGLTNVRRHARATRAEVSVRLGADAARLTVVDDGGGFSPEAETGGSGLRGLRERVGLLGGRLRVDSSTTGTILLVELPGGRP